MVKPVTTQADSSANRPSWPYSSQALPYCGCTPANKVVATAVVNRVISKNTARRRLAARSQAAWAVGAAGVALPLPVRPIRAAVPMLFQKPRQGTGTMELRFNGGAVTALGCRSSRRVLRVEMVVGWVFMAGISANPVPCEKTYMNQRLGLFLEVISQGRAASTPVYPCFCRQTATSLRACIRKLL